MRRVITSVGADGKSVVMSDDAPPVAFHATSPTAVKKVDGPWTQPAVPTGEAVVHELWTLGNEPTSRCDDPTLGIERPSYDPPPGSTKWIVTEMGPHLNVPLHQTPTVDYAVVVAGEVTLGLEDGGVLLDAGDAVLVNGVVHSWQAGPNGCVIATVLVGLSDNAR